MRAFVKSYGSMCSRQSAKPSSDSQHAENLGRSWAFTATQAGALPTKSAHTMQWLPQSSPSVNYYFVASVARCSSCSTHCVCSTHSAQTRRSASELTSFCV
eukprot:6185591-Pleurochrysis_carterae.AAC.3